MWGKGPNNPAQGGDSNQVVNQVQRQLHDAQQADKGKPGAKGGKEQSVWDPTWTKGKPGAKGGKEQSVWDPTWNQEAYRSTPYGTTGAGASAPTTPPLSRTSSPNTHRNKPVFGQPFHDSAGSLYQLK